MANGRPDPETLLAKIKQDARRAERGRLKVFLGAAAGVGKTYAMLQAAQALHAQGKHPLVGIIETHGRSETAALLAGLEVLPRRRVPHGNATLEEFDIEAMIARHPALALVDELAHSNPPGSRHSKRWQDVDELLAVGIDVYTTLNIQHIESLNDVVTQITGVRVWETVPDTFFEQADEVELVDLPPDELLQRLKEGKIYLPQQAAHAIENFFRKGNLIALRELALRRTADRVDVQMREYREGHAITPVWPVRDRILVCIGPGPEGEKLVRAGKRLAGTARGEWIVVYIETPDLLRLSEAQRNEVAETLRLAASLGAETATLSGGQQFSAEVLDYAHARNVSKIVIGKPHRSGLQRWLFGSIVDAIVAGSGAIDVNIVSTHDEEQGQRPRTPGRVAVWMGLTGAKTDYPSGKSRRRGYLLGFAVLLLCTLVAAAMVRHFELTNIVMVYLLGVVVVAMRYGRGPAVASAVLSVAAFDFFFVPPYYTFAVSDTQYLVTFAVMLVVGLVISNLAASLRLQARVAGHRERRTAALYAMSRELASTRGREQLMGVATRHLQEVFEAGVQVLLPDKDGRMQPPPGWIAGASPEIDAAVAQWVYDHGQAAGHGTDTLPGHRSLYLPLNGPNEALGVLVLEPGEPRSVMLPEQRRLLEAFAGQIALALERVRLTRQRAETQLRMETERFRNALLSAISHDLRTPLAAIVGASSNLLQEPNLSADARSGLARDIHDGAQRMSDLVNKVLEMVRLQSGGITLQREWHPLEEVVGSVLHRMRARLEGHPVTVRLPEELPWLSFDAGLIEELLANLLENAAKYTPAQSPIEIGAEIGEDEVIVEVADRGPGLPPGSERQVFEKFYRVQAESAYGGVGLGLAICLAIAEAHGGRIWAENRQDGGASFRFSLPAVERPPEIEHESGE
jgi:two-component system sensor histidine kinase KdpD